MISYGFQSDPAMLFGFLLGKRSEAAEKSLIIPRKPSERATKRTRERSAQHRLRRERTTSSRTSLVIFTQAR